MVLRPPCWLVPWSLVKLSFLQKIKIENRHTVVDKGKFVCVRDDLESIRYALRYGGRVEIEFGRKAPFIMTQRLNEHSPVFMSL